VTGDIKPANILFSRSTASAKTGNANTVLDNITKLGDFGLAARIDAESYRTRGSGALLADINEEWKEEGDTTALGTTTYAAPEQLAKRHLSDPRLSPENINKRVECWMSVCLD